MQLFSFEGLEPRRRVSPWRASLKRRRETEESGDNDREAPPVPMPNTEVKLSDADDSQLATARENMSLPGTTPKRETAWVFSICAGYGTATRRTREREGLGAEP